MRDSQSCKAAARLPPRLSALLSHHKRLASITACSAARGICSSANAASNISSPEPVKLTSAKRRAHTIAPVSSGMDAITSGAAAVRCKNRKAPSSPMFRLSSCKLSIILVSPRPSASRTKFASAASSNSLCSLPSTGLKPGTNPASSGKLPSRDWQKLWMVNICNPPPGASSTFANICRAFLRASGPASAPIASRSWNRILSSNWTHDANN